MCVYVCVCARAAMHRASVLAMVCRGRGGYSGHAKSAITAIGDGCICNCKTDVGRCRARHVIGDSCICYCNTERIALQTFYISSDCRGKSFKQFHM
jgi:hypothetical protein